MKSGVVWVSTVLYILISLAVIGLVLAAVKPRIDAARDKVIIEQTIDVMNEIDEAILSADQTQGTKLKREIKISKGILTINRESEQISWEFDSKYQYSEENADIDISNIKALTEKSGSVWKVTLTLDYAAKVDLNFDDTQIEKTLQPSETLYSLFFENKGSENIEDLNTIDITII